MGEREKKFAADAEIRTVRYRGPDRREEPPDAEADVSTEVTFDSKGNPVLDMRTKVPRRRHDDDTVDLLKCLDDSALSLEEDD